MTESANTHSIFSIIHIAAQLGHGAATGMVGANSPSAHKGGAWLKMIDQLLPEDGPDRKALIEIAKDVQFKAGIAGTSGETVSVPHILDSGQIKQLEGIVSKFANHIEPDERNVRALFQEGTYARQPFLGSSPGVEISVPTPSVFADQNKRLQNAASLASLLKGNLEPSDLHSALKEHAIDATGKVDPDIIKAAISKLPPDTQAGMADKFKSEDLAHTLETYAKHEPLAPAPSLASGEQQAGIDKIATAQPVAEASAGQDGTTAATDKSAALGQDGTSAVAGQAGNAARDVTTQTAPASPPPPAPEGSQQASGILANTVGRMSDLGRGGSIGVAATAATGTVALGVSAKNSWREGHKVRAALKGAGAVATAAVTALATDNAIRGGENPTSWVSRISNNAGKGSPER